MSKKTIIILTLIILLLAGGAYFWFFYLNIPLPTFTSDEPAEPVSFTPLSRTDAPPVKNTPATTTRVTEPAVRTQPENIPTLRHLSVTPIGGFMASSTASSTLVRYIDRGVGHIYEVLSANTNIDKISNTTIPRVYESYWNKNGNVAILRYLKEENDTVVNFYSELRKTATSSATVTTPYEIKGKFLSPAIKEIAISPKADRIFTFNLEENKGVGYISGFDENKKTRVLDTPLTQVRAEWPEENTIAITTKASGVSAGHLYFLDIKKGLLKKIIGGITGLATKTASNGKKVLFSIGGNKVSTALYNIKDSSTQEIVFKTLADKCVWSKMHADDVYCAVPNEIPTGIYPDDWYKGNISFVDQIWHLDTTTGEVHLLVNLLNLSNDLIDATDLTLDPKENFLYFVNKRDMTLWSLDLNN